MAPDSFDAAGRPRPAYRPIAAPRRPRRGTAAVLVSFLLHLALVLAVFLPPVIASQLDLPPSAGAGGDAPAGGGGGGARGSGAERVIPERVTYFQVAPAPAPVPTPETKPPEPPKPKPPEVPPQAQPPTPAPAEPAPAQTAGTGGSSGNDRSTGSGPGSGGGVGSGVGTGRGSGTGPGTGGGGNEIYPPTPAFMSLLPAPPKKIRPYVSVAWFDVDEQGRTTLLAFNPSKDRAYNRRVREVLTEWRFRPAVRADGTPVRDTIPVEIRAPD